MQPKTPLTGHTLLRRLFGPSTPSIPNLPVIIDDLTLLPPLPPPSPFFLLPTEIRTQILTLAFGNRPIHIDLVYAPPLRHMSDPDPGNEHHHAHRGAHLWSYPSISFRAEGPARWRWEGCTCHRTSDLAYADGCLTGLASCIDPESGYEARDCFVGCFGFMVSCKRAYVETLEVLAGTCRVILSSTVLVANLGRLLPAALLRRLRKVEVGLSFDVRKRRVQKKKEKWWRKKEYVYREEDFLPEHETELELFEKCLGEVVGACPALREVRLSFSGMFSWCHYDGDVQVKAKEKEVFGIVDGFVRRLKVLESMIAEAPSSMYDGMIRWRGLGIDEWAAGFWRRVEERPEGLKDRKDANSLQGAQRMLDMSSVMVVGFAKGPGKGYQIIEGPRDMVSDMVCMAF